MPAVSPASNATPLWSASSSSGAPNVAAAPSPSQEEPPAAAAAAFAAAAAAPAAGRTRTEKRTAPGARAHTRIDVEVTAPRRAATKPWCGKTKGLSTNSSVASTKPPTNTTYALIAARAGPLPERHIARHAVAGAEARGDAAAHIPTAARTRSGGTAAYSTVT